MTITALPTPPSRANPTTFASDADAFLGALPDFATEANALASDVSAKQITASSAATTATTQAGIATAKAAEASASANTAANIAGASAWVSGNAYAIGDCVYSPSDLQTYRRKTNGSGTTDPSLDSTNWTPLTGALPTASQAEIEAGTEAGLRAMSPLRIAQAIAALGGSSIIRDARTTNTVLGAADSGKWIDITSGTFTQTFAAAATLGNGWFCYLGNSGSGDITLDPNGSETIDGLVSFVMYPGEVRIIQCDGTALRTILVSGENILHVRDEKPYGTDGGASTVSTWAIRTLNTVVKNTVNGAALSSNKITLPSGRYEIFASCPFAGVNVNTARLYNVTDSVTVIKGTSGYGYQNYTGAGCSFITGVFYITGTKEFRVEHWCSNNPGSGAFGVATGISSSFFEVYTDVFIRRIG